MRKRSGPVPTVLLIGGLAATGIALPAHGPVDIFTTAAVGVGISLAVTTAIEAAKSFRSLFRVDLLILWILYGLTLLEFLFPQPGIDAVVSDAAAVDGTYAVLLGFFGIAIGRHLVPHRTRYGDLTVFAELRARHVFLLFLLCTLVGYFHMFLAVNF